MLANDSDEQKQQQGGFSLLVNAGRGVAELMAESTGRSSFSAIS
jgi:hypothetical protein